MAGVEKVYVVCYDISRAIIRRKVAGLLEEKLCRVQMSVFEGRLSKSGAQTLFHAMSSLINKGDSIRMYALTKPAMENSRVIGGAPLSEDHDFWLL